jgi:tetratricopeptide (TPR) repeat protein
MRRGIVFTVMFLGWLFGPPSDAQKANEAYAAKKYKDAIALYESAFDRYPNQHAALNFNIGQSWLRSDSAAKALAAFGRVTNAHSENPQMGSWSWNQIGAIFATGKDQPAQTQQPPLSPGSQPSAPNVPNMSGMGSPNGMPGQSMVSREKLEQALVAFKDALKLDNENDIARYNYELIKRKLQQQDQNQQQDQQQDQQKEDQPKDQKNQDQKDQKQPENKENQGNQGNQGEPKDAEQMSQEEAERILQAMNANEKKFLQQIEKGKKHRTYNEDGPDW